MYFISQEKVLILIHIQRGKVEYGAKYGFADKVKYPLI